MVVADGGKDAFGCLFLCLDEAVVLVHKVEEVCVGGSDEGFVVSLCHGAGLVVAIKLL